jgi:hypothetical protein
MRAQAARMRAHKAASPPNRCATPLRSSHSPSARHRRARGPAARREQGQPLEQGGVARRLGLAHLQPRRQHPRLRERHAGRQPQRLRGGQAAAITTRWPER